jgi:hypothetical protein
MKIRRTYKYWLYTSKRDKHLHQQIDMAGIIWNHALALQKRYYRLTGKYISWSVPSDNPYRQDETNRTLRPLAASRQSTCSGSD